MLNRLPEILTATIFYGISITGMLEFALKTPASELPGRLRHLVSLQKCVML